MLEHLEKFEGLRGAGYVLVLISVFAPGTLSMYLFAPGLFERLDLAKMLALIGSIGALTAMASMLVIAIMAKDVTKFRDSPAPHMVGAFGASCYAQLMSLAAVSALHYRPAWGFKTWVVLNFVIVGALTMGSAIYSGFLAMAAEAEKLRHSPDEEADSKAIPHS